jgi:peptidoglycan hydrolase CwlO-like protein
VRGRTTWAALIVALVLAVAAGCGGSSSDESTSQAPPPTSSAPKDAFCGAAGQLTSLQAQLIPLANSMGDADAMDEQLDRLQDRARRYQQQAPDELQDDIETLQSAVAQLTKDIQQHADDPNAIAGAVSGSLQSGKVRAAAADIQAWVQQHC